MPTTKAEPAAKEPRKPRAKPAEEKPAEEDPKREKNPQQRVTEGQVPVLVRPEYAKITEVERKKLNLWMKRAHIIGELGSVPKRGYNAFHKYAYALEADVTAYLGPLMEKYMVVFDFDVMLDRVERIELYTTQNGATMILTRVPMKVALINADNPTERVEFVWVGEGADSGDKGLYKTYTGLLKFLYMKLFMIATGDDPEAFERTDALAESGGRRGVEVLSDQGTGTAPATDVRQSRARQPEKGGRQTETTEAQIKHLGNLSAGLDYGPRGTAEIIDQVLSSNLTDTLAEIDEERDQKKALVMFLAARPGTDTGKVIHRMTQIAEEAAGVRAASPAEAGSGDPSSAALLEGETTEATEESTEDEAALLEQANAEVAADDAALDDAVSGDEITPTEQT